MHRLCYTEMLLRGAREVCRVRERRVRNPWMIGRKEEVARMRREIEDCLAEITDLTRVRRTRAAEQMFRVMS